MTSVNLRITSFLVIVGVASLAAFSYSLLNGRNGTRNIPLEKATLEIGSHAFSVEIANDDASRVQGLSGRESLASHEGMLFLFDAPGRYGFWMYGMKFPLDLVWIKGNEIVGFSENAEPEPGVSEADLKLYYAPALADKVLEINAGLVEEYSFQAGDRIVIK